MTSGERRNSGGLGKALRAGDLRILSELQRDGSLSNSVLGGRVGLSESAAARHRHRLEKEGYIQRYAALLDFARLGYAQTAFVEVGLAEQHEEALTLFEAEVAQIEEVTACWAAAGEVVDYLLRVVARDTHDYERIRHRLARLPGVANLHTHVVLNDVLLREALLP